MIAFDRFVADVFVRRSTRRVCGVLLAATASVAAAQDPTPGADLPTDARATGAAKPYGTVFLPVLGAGPTFGLGAGGVVSHVFKMDAASQRSGVGIGGFVAERSSWLVGAGGRLDFHQDAWHTLAGIEGYDVHYRFFGIGPDAGDRNQSVITQQKGHAEVAEAMHRIFGPLYAGLRYRFDGVTMGVDHSDFRNPLMPLVRLDSTVHTGEGGVSAEYDSRDDESSPHRGTFSRGSAMYARDWLGSDRSIDSYDFWLNHYVPVGSDVLAFRASVCSVGNASPIWQLCMFGARNDLRGYSTGRYRDNTMYAVQSEYRARVWGRWGVSGFVGVGEVEPTWSDIGNHILVSGGPGLRYLLSETHRLNLTTEYAFASHGGAFYFRVGEAF